VFVGLIRDPYRQIVLRWNWKSAVLSCFWRGLIFFTANLSAGLSAAVGAAAADLVYRATTAGFYGAISQAFRKAQPTWAAMLAALAILPAFNHACEFVLHSLRGTPRLGLSVATSIAFSVFSALFNLYVMRRGVLIVGQDRQSLWADLRQMPRMVAGFVAAGPLTLWRFLRKPKSPTPPNRLG
jgi:hypothetical protein